MKNKEVDFNKILVDVMTGEPLEKAMATKEDLMKATVTETVDGKEVKKIDKTKLPRETVGTVLMTCISRYIADDPDDGFYIRILVDLIREAQARPHKMELKEKLTKFLKKFIKESTRIKKDDKESGVYQAWLMAQVAEEIGVGPEGLMDEEEKEEPKEDKK